MPGPERGRTAAGFREQVLARLRNAAREQGVPVDRLQRRLAFERFLARLAESGDWVLKGGFALELPYGWQNRPTYDIDLRTDVGTDEALQRLLRVVAEASADDHFRYELGEAGTDLQGPPGGGLRVRVIARIAGLVFATFAIDLSSGDPLVQGPEMLTESNLLRFAGIEPVRFPTYPVAQHLAEKLHAYTLPRAQDNTHTKDLVDMITIAAMETIDGDALATSVAATFEVRGSHPIPEMLPIPPAFWAASFRQLAAETAISPTTALTTGYELAARLWTPVLTGTARARQWRPTLHDWEVMD